MSWKKLLPAHTYPHHATYCLLSPPPPLLLLCPIFVYMHQKKITFSAAKIHGNIFLSRILTSNIYALSLNPHKKKLRETVKLHLEKKSSKKKSAWWKRTLLSADVWKKKKVLNVKFFLTCSRATSSEEQICLKTKILIEVYGKKKKTTMKETKQTTFICYYCWLTLTKSIFSWNQFFTKISILYLERNREQQTQIYMKSPPEDLSEQKMMMISKISLMSKTMRRKKINVQNLPYMIQYENSFRKSQISVTTLLAFQE